MEGSNLATAYSKFHLFRLTAFSETYQLRVLITDFLHLNPEYLILAIIIFNKEVRNSKSEWPILLTVEVTTR